MGKPAWSIVEQETVVKLGMQAHSIELDDVATGNFFQSFTHLNKNFTIIQFLNDFTHIFKGFLVSEYERDHAVRSDELQNDRITRRTCRPE
jgi:hypothetical protein